MDLLSIILDNITNSNFFVDIFSKIETIAILIILGIFIPIELVMMIKSDCIDEYENKKFRKYLSSHSSGFYLKNIDVTKEYIVLEESFFNNISEHGRGYKCNLDEVREHFLIEYGFEYNIIVCVSGEYSNKCNKIIEYCRYRNLPVCRVIDFAPKRIVQERVTYNGEKIYYYKLDD